MQGFFCFVLKDLLDFFFTYKIIFISLKLRFKVSTEKQRNGLLMLNYLCTVKLKHSCEVTKTNVYLSNKCQLVFLKILKHCIKNTVL